MRKDAGVDGDAQRLSQLVWMIFLKVFDAREEELELDDDYKSPIPEALRWRNWAIAEDGITGGELLDFIDRQLFPTLKGLVAKADERGRMVGRVFEDANNYMKNGTLIRQVINKLNAIDFNKQQDRHQFGDIYEKLLKDLQGAGNAGEYYTPRAVTQFIVDMVNPGARSRLWNGWLFDLRLRAFTSAGSIGGGCGDFARDGAGCGEEASALSSLYYQFDFA